MIESPGTVDKNEARGINGFDAGSVIVLVGAPPVGKPQF
jgi:hypothetical protein